MEYKRSLPYRKAIIWKIFYKVEAYRTLKYEKKIIDSFQQGWFISKEDAEFLSLTESAKIMIVPNPVHISDCQKNYSTYNKLIFVGNLSVSHNIHAVQFLCLELMPELLRLVPGLILEVVGATPGPEIIKYNGINNTLIIGFVDDLYNKLLESDIFLAPMFFSAGIQNKVLEAMAVGLPVVTTTNVLISLGAIRNEHIIVADNLTEYVECLRKLISSLELRQKIGSKGYYFVKQNFSEQQIDYLLDNRIKSL